MSFESLYEAMKRGELMLIDGGMCHWHLRADGQLTIYEIFSTRKGAGSEMLKRLMQVPNVTWILARCPTDLASNEWYARKGFQKIGDEKLKSGRKVNVWVFRK